MCILTWDLLLLFTTFFIWFYSITKGQKEEYGVNKILYGFLKIKWGYLVGPMVEPYNDTLIV